MLLFELHEAVRPPKCRRRAHHSHVGTGSAVWVHVAKVTKVS